MALIGQSVTKNKDIALIWVVLNPIQLLGGGIQNIGAINDAIFYLIIYLIQAGQGRFSTAIAALATYFDPRTIFIVFPLIVY